MLAVEIDGNIHNLPDVILKYIRRDEFLVSLGWKMYRIKTHYIFNNLYKSIEKLIKELDLMVIVPDFYQNCYKRIS